MKKLLFLIGFTALIAVSCKKSTASSDTTDNNTGDSPRTEVPQEMLTNDGQYWTIGTISSVYFHNTESGAYYDYVRNGGGVVVFFKFKPGGYFENLVYVVVNSYGTSTETWTSLEGTVEFKTERGKNVFITHATKGTYRVRQNGSDKSRPVPASDLANQHSNKFLWENWQNPDDATRRYFLLVNLDYYPTVDLDNLSGTLQPEWVDKFHVEN
jgi:hypothetical protein